MVKMLGEFINSNLNIYNIAIINVCLVTTNENYLNKKSHYIKYF